MRTTINIDDRLLEASKRRARGSNRTIGDVVDDALRDYLSAPGPHQTSTALPVFTRGTGFAPGIDPRSNSSIYAAADEPDDNRRAAAR